MVVSDAVFASAQCILLWFGARKSVECSSCSGLHAAWCKQKETKAVSLESALGRLVWSSVLGWSVMLGLDNKSELSRLDFLLASSQRTFLVLWSAVLT